MIRFSKLATALAILPVIAAASPVFAGSPGQLAGGDNYVARNVTQNGSYGNTTSATCNEEVKYSMQLSNTQFSALNNVTLKVTLPANGGVSTATATTDLGGTSGTSDTTTVNLSSGASQSLESGTTVLYDGNGNVIKTLSDSIVAGGVNIGSLNGSTTEFVNFKAKVSCPIPTPVVSFACTELDVNQIDRTHYDFTAHATVQNATVQSFGFIAKDANSNTVDTNTVNTNALSAVYHFNQSTAGTYTVSASVTTDKGTASSSNCVKQITVSAAPQVLPATTPTALPNTGAGDVLGIFAGASSLGAAGHFVSRRFRRG